MESLTQTHWNLFFDLHGVLADVNAVNKNYQYYLEKILIPVGLSQDAVIEIHKKAFKGWIRAINYLFNKQEEGIFDSNLFLRDYQEIDERWEKYILDFVPVKHRNKIKPLLKTSLVEYEALAEGPYSILFPEVLSVLNQCTKFDNLKMYVASSASSNHVRGAIILHNLSNYFLGLIGYDTVGAPKKVSSGIYFKNMIQLVKANPEYSIFVGDSLEEANLTTKLGMTYVMVRRKDSTPLIERINASFTFIEDLEGLIPILQELMDY